MIDEKEMERRELWECARKIRKCCKSHLFNDAKGYSCLKCPFYLDIPGYLGCVFDMHDRGGATPATNWFVH